MPFIIGEARSVDDIMLFNKPAKRSASIGGFVNNTITTNVNDKIYEAGENITAGNAVRLFTDGKIYESTPLNSDNLYAQWFAVDTVTSGNNVTVRRTGEIASTNTLTINLPVYLIIAIGGINISQTPITEKSSTADLWQYLGYATTANTIAIDIKLPELFLTI